MPEKSKKDLEIPYIEVILEAIKRIRNEILLYGIVIAVLFVSSAYFGIEVLREVKWPLIVILTIALIAYFFTKAIPQAKKRIRGIVKITDSQVIAKEIGGVIIKEEKKDEK